MKKLALLAVILAASGCYFEAPTDITKGQETHKPSAYFAVGTHYFKGKGTRYLEVTVTDRKAKIVTRNYNSTGSDYSREISRIATTRRGDAKWVSDRDFHIGVYKGSDGYQFFTFTWRKDYIGWVKASESGEKVSSLAQLIRVVNSYRSTDKLHEYTLIGYQEGLALRKRDRAHEAAAAAEKKRNADQTASTSSGSTTTKPSANSKTALLDVGDGVYVQGIFSDELAIIVRIDHASGRVKVRRSKDGTTKWVSANDILTREQSTINDVGRVGIGVGVMVCLLSPETCKKK